MHAGVAFSVAGDGTLVISFMRLDETPNKIVGAAADCSSWHTEKSLVVITKEKHWDKKYYT